MRTFLTTLTLAAALSSSAVLAQSVTPDPAYTAENQFTATLDQSNHRWQLLPAYGQDLDIRSEACPVANNDTSPVLAEGIWVVTSDEQGRPELVAPSSIVLPEGASDSIALRPCGQAGDDSSLSVPQALIDLLVADIGAVYVSH